RRLCTARIPQGERIFAVVTTLPTLAPGSDKAAKAHLWNYVRDDRSFGAADRSSLSNASRTVASANASPAFWEGYCGILQVDGYAYNRLARPDRAKDGVMLEDVRRKFYELQVTRVRPLSPLRWWRRWLSSRPSKRPLAATTRQHG
ncbi:MAG: hypothetical protein E5Y18_11915, partial [Mesorhizobium sp.]